MKNPLRDCWQERTSISFKDARSMRRGDWRLEWQLLREYKVWLESMLMHAGDSRDAVREPFFEGLLELVKEDWTQAF